MTKSFNLDRSYFFTTFLAAALTLAAWTVTTGINGLQNSPQQVIPAGELHARYVVEYGTDERNDCLIFEYPCATITHAMHIASVSDPIVVDVGTYHALLRHDSYPTLPDVSKNHIQNQIYVHDYKSAQNARFFMKPVFLAILGLLLFFSFTEAHRRISIVHHPDFKQWPPAEIQTITDSSCLSDEKVFLNKLNAILEKHISDDRFNVELLASEMNMSSRNLRRKTRSFLGESPVAILRRCRLEMAREMLLKNTDNISQIAYQCGFSDPGYFTRCFRLEYGTLPSQYKAA